MYKVMEKSKRMLAFLLSAVMVLSTVEGSVLTAFAAEENEVAVSEATVNEVQTAEVDAQSVSGGDVSGDEGGEENTYAGTEFTDNWGEGDFYGFEINAWEMDENADFEAEALSILTGLEKTYDIVSISFRSLADAVSKDLWNAAVAATDSANKDYEKIRINFGSGSEAPNENWCFNDVTAISDENITSVNLGITVAFSETSGGGATIHTDENLSNLSSIAGCANVNISADSEGRAEAFNAMQTAFGTESMDLEVADNNGDIVSGGYFNCNSYNKNLFYGKF